MQQRDNTEVQGPCPGKDPLDRLVAIAIRVAAREGLLNEPVDELPTEDRAEQKADEQRSA